MSPAALDLLANDMWALGALLVFMLTGRDLFGTDIPNTGEKERTKCVVSQQIEWVRP